MNLKNVERNNIVLKRMASPMTIIGLFMLSVDSVQVDSVQVDLNVQYSYCTSNIHSWKIKVKLSAKGNFFILLLWELKSRLLT